MRPFEAYEPFEAAALEALRRHLRTQGRTLADAPRAGARPVSGALAPEGVDDLPGPTLVELKLHLTPHGVMQSVQQLMTSARDVGAGSALLILGAPVAPAMESALLGLAGNYPPPPAFRLWTFEKLAELLARHAEHVAVEVPELARAGVAQIIERPDDPASARAAHVAELKEAYRHGRLVLFVGAGASVEAGAPAWGQLLDELLLALVSRHLAAREALSSDDTERLAAALRARHGSTPLLMARYLRAGLGDDFADEIARSLYRRAGDGATSPTLQAIARLCVPRRDGSGVHAVVTYNFDDLLERHLESAGVAHRALHREADRVGDDELGVHHVHGFLPRERRRDGDADGILVFSEEGYHAVLADPYAWSNLAQLQFLRDRTCLLVGLSATDPNLRRLAELAARRARGPRHFIVLRRAELPADAGGAPLSPALRRAFDRANHGLQEAALRELGLHALWIDGHAELPALLDDLRR